MKNQSGVVILLSLVMTMALIVSAAILASITIREARVSSIVDQGMTALYGTESAIERSLYQLLVDGADPADLDGGTGVALDEIAWTRTAKNKTDRFVMDFIPTGSFRTINLYNRDNANAAAGVSDLQFSWGAGTQLSVEVSAWDGAQLSNSVITTLNCAGTDCAGSIPLNPSYAYELIITAAGTSAVDLQVTTTPAGTMVDLPTTVTVIGEYRGSEQAVELILPVTPPWNEPLPNLLCGNGALDGGEQCDDGNTVSGDGCSSACQIESTCGNSVLEGSEQCDDGNTVNGDGCSSVCQLEAASCGNGIIELAEECDNGSSNSNTAPNACRLDCTNPACGDDVIDSGEYCDDGNLVNGDGCDSSCQYEGWCGDGVVDPGEECDFGNGWDIISSDPSRCTETCTLTCGDIDFAVYGTQCVYDSTQELPGGVANRRWQESIDFCSAKGAHLPTLSELNASCYSLPGTDLWRWSADNGADPSFAVGWQTINNGSNDCAGTPYTQEWHKINSSLRFYCFKSIP